MMLVDEIKAMTQQEDLRNAESNNQYNRRVSHDIITLNGLGAL